MSAPAVRFLLRTRAHRPTAKRADRPTAKRADRPSGQRADRPSGKHADRPSGGREWHDGYSHFDRHPPMIDVVVAIDIGGTGLKCALVDVAGGAIRHSARHPTGADR